MTAMGKPSHGWRRWNPSTAETAPTRWRLPSPPAQQSAAEPQDEADDDDEEEDAHEAGAARDSQPGAEVATGDVGRGHRQGQLPDDRPLRHEDRQRREVRRPVGELGLGRGLEEVVAEQPDQREDEERPRARPDRTVVEADRQTGEHDGGEVPTALEPQVGE